MPVVPQASSVGHTAMYMSPMNRGDPPDGPSRETTQICTNRVEADCSSAKGAARAQWEGGGSLKDRFISGWLDQGLTVSYVVCGLVPLGAFLLMLMLTTSATSASTELGVHYLLL